MNPKYRLVAVLSILTFVQGCEFIAVADALSRLNSIPASRSTSPSNRVHCESGTGFKSLAFESSLNNNELSEPGSGFAGKYVSTITGATQSLPTRCKDPIVELTREGREISGTFGCSRCLLWGEIEDGVISFKYQSSTGNSGSGKWTLEPDSNEITGKWISSWMGEGEWSLVRIE